MPTEVILPRVDMDMASGRISRWFAEDGGRVEKGQPLFEIETDKAAMDVEAPASGILHALAGMEGTDLPVGSTVAWILAEGESKPDAAGGADAAGDHGGSSSAPIEQRPPAAGTAQGDVPAPHAGAAAGGAGTMPRASPLARRLARERGIDLAAVPGSGPRGRIQRADIEAFTPGRAEDDSEPAQRLQAPPRRTAAPGPLHVAWLRQGSGPPIAFLHGFGADLNGWRPFLAGSDLARPVLAIDLPGHGKSPLQAPVSFEVLAAAAERALLESGAAFDLVGHSLGAAVAASVAARRAVPVRSLLLLAPAGLGPEINGAFLEGYTGARREESLGPWMRQLVADETALGEGMVRATFRQRQDGALPAAQGQIVRALFPDGTQVFSIRALLASIEAPVKIVFGTDDQIIPAHHARGLPGRLAVHVFPGVGHMPHLEAKADIQRLLGELLRSAAD